MGKVVERVKLKSLFDPEKEIEIDAVVDTGATLLMLPMEVVEKLSLRKIRDVSVRYANNQTQLKAVYGVVTVELKGRIGNFDVLAEEQGSQALIGQIVLEELDLVVDPKRGTLTPNPESPDMPMLEILG